MQSESDRLATMRWNVIGHQTLTRRRIMLGATSIVGAFYLAACGAAKGQTAGNTSDFKLVSYDSGSGILPSGETSFAHVRPADKPLILNFWAGDCPACRGEMPAFQNVADQYRDRIIILGVDLGVFTGLGTHQSAKNLLDELKIHYPTAYAVDDKPVRIFGIRAMPTTVFFGKSGQILTTSVGMLSESQLRSNVERLLTT